MKSTRVGIWFLLQKYNWQRFCSVKEFIFSLSRVPKTIQMAYLGLKYCRSQMSIVRLIPVLNGLYRQPKKALNTKPNCRLQDYGYIHL